jgi:hypothetical protein
MEKTWKGTWGGILTIIGGCFGIGVGAFVASGAALAGVLAGAGMGMLSAIGAPLIGMGIVALIGGIVTLRRRAWGFALTGAILALFPIVPLGVLAIIFVFMGRREFA